MAKCNNDCLNCSLPHCKFDRVKKEPIPKSKPVRPRKYKKVIHVVTKPKKEHGPYKRNDPDYHHNWYLAHREEVLYRAHLRYAEKKDEIREYQKKYQKEHIQEWRKGGKYYYKDKESCGVSEIT